MTSSIARADCGTPTQIRFHNNATSATVSGGILRDEDKCWRFDARAGQTLSVGVQSPDDNVVLTIFRPGFKLNSAQADTPVSGETLPGVADSDEAKQAQIQLPATGRYLILLGTTRGAGGQYTLKVGIR